MRWSWLGIPPAIAGGWAVIGVLTPAADAQELPADDLGAQLFAAQCASCHGSDGTGVDDRGPSLEHEGAASADFVLRTG